MRAARGNDKLPNEQEAALTAAVRWVLDPDDKNRRAAEAPGREVTLEHPAGCLAMGAFWSGGSILAPNLPVFPPKPFVTAKTVSGAVLVAAARLPREQRPEGRQQFAAVGLDILFGKHLWQ